MPFGGNEEAARLSGIPVRRILVTVYALAGVFAGLAGLVLACLLYTSPSPRDVEESRMPSSA